MDGRAIFLLTADTPPLLASVERVGTTLWRIEQVAGIKNGPAITARQRSLTAALTTSLTSIGHQLVEVDPFEAMHFLTWHTRRDPFGAAEDADHEDAA